MYVLNFIRIYAYAGSCMYLTLFEYIFWIIIKLALACMLSFSKKQTLYLTFIAYVD